jgi:hypothetical protein
VHVDFQKKRIFFMHDSPRNCAYSTFAPDAEPAGPAPRSSGCPLADDEPFADEPDAGSGVIGATPPELAVVVVMLDDELVEGAGTLGGVLVGPLKLIGCVPASICGVTT